MRIHAPRTVAVAILAITGCGSFDLRHGGTIAHKLPAASEDTAQGGSTANQRAQRFDGQSSYVAEQLQQGGLHEQQGHVREARACYVRALQKDPGNVTAHHRLAITHDLDGQYIESEQHYLAALESGLANSDVLSDLGYSYLLQRRYYESEQALQEALQNNPNHQFALGHLGTLYGWQGDYQRAKEYLTRAGGEVKAQQELARLFPQGPTMNPAIAAQGPLSPLANGQNSMASTTRKPPATAAAATPATQYPNDATRKLAEQIALERQKLAKTNAGSPNRTAAGVPPASTNNLPNDRRGAVAAAPGANAAALAEQKRQRALDYLRNGPTHDLNRKFSELDSQAGSRPNGGLIPRAGGTAAGEAQFGGIPHADRPLPIEQTSGIQTSEQGSPSMDRNVTQIPTQSPRGNASPIPTQIPDTVGNPFARPGDSHSIEQARAIAAQMGFGAGTGSLPPVTAPDPNSRTRSATASAPGANTIATTPQADSILLQPPANSPTVQQALTKPPIQQPPPWSPQPPRQLPPGGNFAPLPQSQGNSAPPSGTPVTVPQLLPNANGQSQARPVPNAELPARANLLNNANVGTGSAATVTDATPNRQDVVDLFQQQQQTIQHYQQELDRLRQQNSTLQMYEYTSGQPGVQQNVPH